MASSDPYAGNDQYTNPTANGGSRYGQAYSSTSTTTSDLKDSAQDAVQNVKEQAQQKSGELIDQVRGQVRSRLTDQKDRASQGLTNIAGAVTHFGQQLRDMDETSEVAPYVESAGREIQRVSEFLDNRDVDDLVVEVENFARRQPTLFLGAAFAIGFLAARFLKSSSEPMYSTQGSYSGGYGGSGYGPGSRSYGQGYTTPGTTQYLGSGGTRRLGYPERYEGPVGGQTGRTGTAGTTTGYRSS